MRKEQSDEGIEATVAKVNNGYIVAYPSNSAVLLSGESITCSNWDDDFPPEKGQLVVLFGVRKYQGGWRAKRAEPISLTGGEVSNE